MMETETKAKDPVVLRIRNLGAGFVWAVVTGKFGIQAISRGEAIRTAKEQMPGTVFVVENL